MKTTQHDQPELKGIFIRTNSDAERIATQQAVEKFAVQLNLVEALSMAVAEKGLHLTLQNDFAQKWMNEFDTLQLTPKLMLKPFACRDDLAKETVVAMLGSPCTFEYPSYAELRASVHIRCNIAEAARRTSLSFHTSKIERPEEFWVYSKGNGFLLRPGKSLTEAIRAATQPELSGQQYSFSCYRASEYVIALGVAEELANCNPTLLAQLERHWQSRAIMSRKFHDTFLYEYGSMEDPLPLKFYVPGDRLWFRNPDVQSSDVEGYEGSWVIYLGSGLFTNFWVCEKPYSMVEKCVEIYHWRHGVEKDDAGNLRMNETIVEARVKDTLQNPAEVERILNLMMRLRDPSGTYEDGGCIDTSREYARWVCSGTADMVLPVIN